MARSLDELEVAFCDEDTPTWTAAACEIGRRAVQEPRLIAFLKTWLESVQQSETNIHRFRHACCGLASYLSQAGADRAPFAETIALEIVGPLTFLAFRGLPEGAVIRDLAQLGLDQAFERWKQAQIEKRKKEIAKFERAGKAQALAANQQKLEMLEALSPESVLPPDFSPETKVHDHSPWALTSYFAGAASIAALMGLPLVPLVRGLCQIALERRNGGLPFVLNVPDMLRAIREETPADDWEAARALLVENVSPTWINERLHYNDYLLALASCCGEGAFAELWGRGVTKPEWLQADLAVLAAVGDAEAPRAAARIMRRIARELFSDDWRWHELDEGARFSLNVFTLLMIHGTDPLRGAGAGKRSSSLSVRHRLAILMKAIEASYHAREQVLPALVRCLKLLLDRELRARNKNEDLLELCARQVSMVRPLVAEWQLPGTMRKDLATIVCRILLAAYQNDRNVFVNLLYTVLFELPDEVLFRELIEYSTEEEVSSLVGDIVELIERWRRPPEKVGVIWDPSAMDRAYQPDLRAFGIYERFAAKLSAISGERKELVWVRHLPRLVAFLARVPLGYPLGEKVVTEPRTERDQLTLDATLFWMLRGKHQDVESWELDSPRGKVDRKGAQWAAQELKRRGDQKAREVYDRFQRTLDDVQLLETDCLPEAGRPRPSDDLVRQWRRLIAGLDSLSRLCDEELPYLERELCVHLLKERIENLEVRLHTLVRVLEKEEEEVAVEMLNGRVQRTVDDPGERLDFSQEDTNLIQDWMLDRYMIRELAKTLRLSALGMLTSAPFVAIWLMSPFLLAIVLNRLGLSRWSGVPFTAITLLDLVLVGLFFWEAQRSKTASAATGKFLLPQITAALFLGISELITNDESWAIANLEYPWVRIFTVVAFLLAGFFFTREVLLGDQLTSKADVHKKNERAGSVMALVLWQSSVLVGIFGILFGRVMGERMDMDLFRDAVMQFGAWLPLQVHVGRWFLDPATDLPMGGYQIYPWALMTWTVQVFFFSAIFERIMRRSD